MMINDDKGLLTEPQLDLLYSNASKGFVLEKYTTLDDILTSLGVEVYIMPGVRYHDTPSFFDEAIEYWKEVAREIEELLEKYDDESDKDALWGKMMKARGKIQPLQSEKNLWPKMPLRGLYDSERKIIELYPEEMLTEYGGTRMDELLVSTLAHETMHAYFDREEHGVFPYVPTVEEPLAEFGMLLYLNETGSIYINWAYDDVARKRTCYRFGANIYDQYCEGDKLLRSYLEAYKFDVPKYEMPEVDAFGKHVALPVPVGKKRASSRCGDPMAVKSVTPPAFDFVYKVGVCNEHRHEIYITIPSDVMKSKLLAKDDCIEITFYNKRKMDLFKAKVRIITRNRVRLPKVIGNKFIEYYGYERIPFGFFEKVKNEWCAYEI